MKTVKLFVTAIGVVAMLTSCGTEHVLSDGLTPHARACSLYTKAVVSSDERCCIGCPEGCQRCMFNTCFAGTDPGDVELIDSCRRKVESLSCKDFKDQIWLPVCDG